MSTIPSYSCGWYYYCCQLTRMPTRLIHVPWMPTQLLQRQAILHYFTINGACPTFTLEECPQLYGRNNCLKLCIPCTNSVAMARQRHRQRQLVVCHQMTRMSSIFPMPIKNKLVPIYKTTLVIWHNNNNDYYYSYNNYNYRGACKGQHL